MNLQKAFTLVSHPFKGYATSTFAITNRCNGRCAFCSIWRQEPVEPIDLKQVRLAIRQLYGLGIRYIQFTGGEPFLYPYLAEAVRYASSLGILSTIVTNGSLISDRMVKRLRDADVGEVQISIDHYDDGVIERNRGIHNLAKKIGEGVKRLKVYGIPVSASTTISRLLELEHDDFRQLLEHNEKLGLRGTYFCYPMSNMESTYALGGDEQLISYTSAELIDIFLHIKELKRQGHPIDNSLETLDVTLDWLQGRKSRYPCLGGYKTFYLDWNLNLFRCMKKSDLIGPILELDVNHVKLERIECEDCLISCMREPSIYFHGLRSIIPILRLALRSRYVNLRVWH